MSMCTARFMPRRLLEALARLLELTGSNPARRRKKGAKGEG